MYISNNWIISINPPSAPCFWFGPLPLKMSAHGPDVFSGPLILADKTLDFNTVLVNAAINM